MVQIRVNDDGPGLPPEAFEVVFRIGERWDSQKLGSGLGLTIVRDLARLYGGDVRLGRVDLGGLSVVLELPVAHSGKRCSGQCQGNPPLTRAAIRIFVVTSQEPRRPTSYRASSHGAV
jgi:hypothetical protein